MDTPSSSTDPGTSPTRAQRVRRIAHAVAAVSLVGLVLGYIQAQSYGIIGVDGYYHIRWSRLLWESFLHGEIPEFTWLPLTILDATRYVDHHFLFHVLQIPFTWFDDLIVGAKLSAVFYGAAAILACYALVLASRVRLPLIWLVALLASSSHFMWRLANPRAMSVTIVTLAVAALLLFARRWIWLGVLAFTLVWMYSLFPLLLVLAAGWTIGDWWQTRRLDWRPMTIASIGLVLGLVLNPYFPTNIGLLVDHALMTVPSDSLVLIGAEWHPLSTWNIVTYSGVALAAQITGWICIRPENREGSSRTICLLIFSTFLALLAFKSRRFLEYWPPFAVVFLAFAAQPWLERVKTRGLASTWQWAVRGAVAVVVVGVGSMLFVVIHQTLQIGIPADNPDVYVGSSRWLKGNTPPGSLVFNADWDDFPMLFFHNTHNAYVSGLALTYLQYADPDAATQYIRICDGEEWDTGRAIASGFGARYAVSAKSLEHEPFIRRARADSSMRPVFEDDYAVVFEITP